MGKLSPSSMSSLHFLAGPALGNADRPAFSVFRTHLPDAAMCRLFDYWLDLVEANGPTVKHLIDPVALADLLPHIYMEEWDHPTAQSKIRLVGEALRELWGGSTFVGARIDDQMHGAINDLWRRCDRSNFQDQAPTLSRYNLQHRNRGYRWVWDLSLPISDKAGERYVLGVVVACSMDDSKDAQDAANDP